MRDLSSSAHRLPISSDEHEMVLIDDAVLPAARHLTGPDALDVLQVTASAAGGEVVSARPVHVQYRPGSELVVRYEAVVSWAGATPVAETLLAATTTTGPLAGTVPLVAETDRGDVSVGVWRWPFDPVLPGLGTAVTPTGLAPLLDADPGRLRLEVVAYRPTERAVVRASADDGGVWYVKVVRPTVTATMVDRHERLGLAGVPVPTVRATDHELGLVVMDELSGTTLRERLKAGSGPWPAAGEYRRLRASLARADLESHPPVRSRVVDAIGHAAMLGEIVPDQVRLLDELTHRLREATERSARRPTTVIHGDLYEAQLIVDGDRVTGLLDIDDAGPGDPLDDLATVLGHLRYRAATTRTGAAELTRYADELRDGFAHGVGDVDGVDDVDPHELDVVTGAVLIGLATGPFRIQQRGWADAVRRHLDAASALIGPTSSSARHMREFSAPRHPGATHRCENRDTGSGTSGTDHGIHPQEES